MSWGLPKDVLIKCILAKEEILCSNDVSNYEHVIRNQEIPKLNSYETEPKNEFWSRFPFNPMPSTAKQNQTINPEVIKSYTESVDLPPIFENIKKDALNSLFNGADLLVDEKQLKPMKVENL